MYFCYKLCYNSLVIKIELGINNYGFTKLPSGP